MKKEDTRNHWQIKHGMSGTKIYKTWHNVRSRCKNPNATKYHIYGGKGIKVCKEWDESFERFYRWSVENGYKEGLTIDRIDGDGDYSPENCRWVDYQTQNNNTSQNNMITFDGITLTAYQWARKIGMNPKTFSERLRRGWPVERAITTPTMKIDNFGNFIKELKNNNVI
jgi:hypothetical protein